MPKNKKTEAPMKEQERYITHVLKTFPLVKKIENKGIREKTVSIFVKAMEIGGWTDMKDVPFTAKIPTKLDYVTHTAVVAAIAVDSALLLKKKGIEVDMDQLIAGALLHDVGKLLEYSKATGHGGRIRHPFSGAALAMEAGLPVNVIHMIATHAEEGDTGMRSVEAVIVHHADLTHFDCVKSLLQHKKAGL